MKKLKKYLLFYFVLLIMMIPLLVQSYHMARQMTFDQFDQQIASGMDMLESQIKSSQELVNVIRQNGAFRRLLLLSGDIQNTDYLTAKELQTFLTPLFASVNIKKDAFLLFRNIPILFLNNSFTNDYGLMYPWGISYSGMNAKEWKSALFDGAQTVRVLPESEITSFYGEKNRYDGITVIQAASFSSIYRPNAVLAYTIDKQDILSAILTDDTLADSTVYLYNNSGQLLLTHNYMNRYPLESPRKLQEIQLDTGACVLTVYESQALGITCVVGIPKTYFTDHIRGMLWTVLLYVLAGSFFLFMLALYFTLSETKKARELYLIAKDCSGLLPDAANEHQYAGMALRQMSRNTLEQLDKIRDLRNSVKHSVLENVLLFGIYTPREENEIKEYFTTLFDQYCIVSAELEVSQDLPIDIGYFADIMYVVENTVLTEFECTPEKLVLNPQQLVLIVPLSSGDNEGHLKLQTLLTHMIRDIRPHIPSRITFHIGISTVHAGAASAKSAYQQSKNALSLHSSPGVSSAAAYQQSPRALDSPMFDASIQMKLYDALIVGGQEIVERIFKEASQRMESIKDDAGKQMQLYFSLLHAVDGVRCELQKYAAADGTEDWPVLTSNPAAGEIGDALKLLEENCRNLILIVQGRRKIKNIELKENLLSFIQASYTDASLSACSIAEAMNISEKYVFTIVKEASGKTLSKYIEDLRINKAEDYLLHTSLQNLEIMERCGFGSAKTFYRVFSKKHSVSPAVWRAARSQTTESGPSGKDRNY